MLTYIILGATGSAGSAVVWALYQHRSSQQPRPQVRYWSRSIIKLFEKHSFLASYAASDLFEGGISKPETLIECLRGSSIIFSCIGSNASEPGQHLAQEAARAIVSALRQIRCEDEKGYKPPTIVMLSSSCVSPIFKMDLPWGVENGA